MVTFISFPFIMSLRRSNGSFVLKITFENELEKSSSLHTSFRLPESAILE